MSESLEEKLLLAVQKEEDREKCLMEESDFAFLYHLSNIRENILEWYDFDPQASLLEIGAECGALTELFCRRVHRVVAVEPSAYNSTVNMERNKKYGNLSVIEGEFRDIEIEEKFDYVTMIGPLAYAGCGESSGNPYMEMLIKAKNCLKPGGKLFLAIENKYGVKYFAGAPEDHTGRCFEGLENYAAANHVRTFSRKALNKMLLEAGFTENEFYYPMPDFKFPSEVYSDKSLPSFGSLRYPCVSYDRDRYELLDERLVFDSVCQDEMFEDFANAFLVISSNGQAPKPEQTVIYAKYNRERAPQFQLSTKIFVGKDGSKYVEKEALCKEANEHVERFSENRRKLIEYNDMLQKAGVREGLLVPVEILRNENGTVAFTFIKGVSLAKEVNASLGHRETFLKAMHQAVDSIYGGFLKAKEGLLDFKMTEEFERIFGTFKDTNELEVLKQMKCLKVSNIDCILSNFVKVSDGELVCLDYEWVFDFPIPLDYLKYRTIYYYYSENIHYIKMSEQELWAEFGLSEQQIKIFRRMDDCFQQYAHGENRRYIYMGNYAKNVFDLGKDIQNGENWFVSIANDIRRLNREIGEYRRDLVRCHVKIHRKSAFLDGCKIKIKSIFRKMIKK